MLHEIHDLPCFCEDFLILLLLYFFSLFVMSLYYPTFLIVAFVDDISLKLHHYSSDSPLGTETCCVLCDQRVSVTGERVCDDPWQSAEPFLRRSQDKSDTHLLCADPVRFVTASQICVILSHLD